MRILVYEHITSGALDPATTPAALLRDGDAMARALVDDLTRIAGTEVRVLRHAALPALGPAVRTIAVEDAAALADRLAEAMRNVDAVWPIAPETDGVLERVNRAVVQSGRLLVGCEPDTVAAAASKHLTARVLAAAGVPCVPTFRAGEHPLHREGRWVVKPDDGAGCEDTWLLSSYAEALAWIERRPHSVAQPWIEGDALSLSLLCLHGRNDVLACNRQVIERVDGRLALARVEVDACHERIGRLRPIATAVARAMPGLAGYVGIDLVDSPHGPVVLEVNPRLTTSYCGLGAALQENVAARVLALFAAEAR